MKPESEMLPCKLTESERDQKAREVNRDVRQLIGLQNEKKDMMADYNARIKAKNAELDVASLVVETGVERRPVQVIPHVNRITGFVEWVRSDTGETVRTKQVSKKDAEELHALEMQMEGDD